MRITIVFLGLFSLLCSCSVKNETWSAVQDNETSQIGTLAKGNTKFALDLLRTVWKEKGDKNIFLSPYSVSSALAMTSAGAKGDTEKQMGHVLHFSGTQMQTHALFSQLNEAIISDKEKDGYELRVANRLWGQKDYHFSKEFLKTTDTYYKAGLEPLNFMGDSEGSRVHINNWVEEQTKNLIKNLIPEGQITGDTKLVLTNAIYFLAEWQQKFEGQYTQPGVFDVGDGQKVEAEMMNQQGSYNYLENSNLGFKVQMLEIPYLTKYSPAEKSTSMFIVLPERMENIPELIDKVSSDQLQLWLHNSIEAMEYKSIHLSLPKFKVEFAVSLKKSLSDLGMNDAFIPNRANFKGMLEEGAMDSLYISNVLHKTMIRLDESGTEAAGATAVVMNDGCALPEISVNVNHPFLYFIRDNKTDSILFIGILMNPAI